MGKVYLGIKGDKVVAHTDLEAMKIMDGIDKPDLIVSMEEYETAGSTARIEGKKIVLGLSKKEIDSRNAQERISEIDKELDAIDRKTERATRAVSYALVSGKTADKSDIKVLKKNEETAISLRAERENLLSIV